MSRASLDHLVRDDAPRLQLVALLASITATGPLALQIFLPALPVVQQDLRTSAAIVQLTLSLSMVAVALATLVYGPCADRFGRRPVLVVGLVLFVLGSIACAVAPTIETLIAARVLQAAGGAAGTVLARTVVRDLFGAERAAAVIAQLTMVMVVAPMVSPTIGGLLTDVVHWRSVFVFAAVAVAALLFWSLRALPETRPVDAQADTMGAVMRGFGSLLSSRRYIGYVLHTASSSVIFFAFISGAPYVMVETLGQPATAYGLWFVLLSGGFMTGNFLAIRSSGRVDQLTLMLVGSLLALAGIGLCVGLVLAGRHVEVHIARRFLLDHCCRRL